MNLIRFKNLSAFRNLRHFVTTRSGGVSTGRFASMNLGFNVGDDYSNVLENYHILAAQIGAGANDFVIARQTHSANVSVLEDDLDEAAEFASGKVLADTDAIITALKDLCIMVRVADCVPLLLYDPQNLVAGVVHAGWRGTFKGAAYNTLLAMNENFGTHPSGVIAAIGPSAGPCCYEVGEDVREMSPFNEGERRNFFSEIEKGGRFLLDLWGANRFQLTEAGVTLSNIETAGMCTICGHKNFFSARYNGSLTGRMGAGVMMTGYPA